MLHFLSSFPSFFDRRLKEVLFIVVSPLIEVVAGTGEFLGAIIVVSLILTVMPGS